MPENAAENDDAAAKSEDQTGATPENDSKQNEALGATGKAALIKEREARKAAEKRAAELENRLRSIEDSGKSEAQKQAEALSRMQSELSEIRAEKARLEVASSKGIPSELLAGPGDDLEAYADALLQWHTSSTPKRLVVDADGKHPNPVPAQTGDWLRNQFIRK